LLHIFFRYFQLSPDFSCHKINFDTNIQYYLMNALLGSKESVTELAEVTFAN